MDEENELEATIVSGPDGESVIVDLPDGETEGENNSGESDAVRIAEIEAEKEIAVAAISADVETARIEAETERVNSWEESQVEIAALRASMTERDERIAFLEGQLAALPNPSQLTPTPQPELGAETVLEIETPPEPNLTPQSTAENETPMEPGQSGEEESAAEITVPARKRRRLI